MKEKDTTEKKEREKSNIDYKTIFKIYELDVLDKSDSRVINMKNDIRRKLRNKLKELYHTNDWNKLTGFQKDQFMYYDIREVMLEYEKTISHKEKIDEKCDYLAIHKVIELNHIRKNLKEKRYCKLEDSDDEKRKAYAEFSKDMRTYFSYLPLPSYEEWSQNPLRIYDLDEADKLEYRQNHLTEDIEEIHTPQEDIDHVILQIIVQYLEKYHGLKINVPLIKECKDYLRFSGEIISIMEEGDISADGLEDDINEYEKIMRYENMLKELTPFYTVEKREENGRRLFS